MDNDTLIPGTENDPATNPGIVSPGIDGDTQDLLTPEGGKE
jgi:hypothetical protein